MSFAVVDHLDVWPLAASLRSKMSLFKSDGIVLVRADERYAPHVKSWPALVALLKELRDLAEARKWELGDINLYRLKSGENNRWGRDLSGVRAELPVVTNPGVQFFAGRVSQHIEAGVLTLVDQTWPTCVVNWGKTTHVHLTITCFPHQEEKPE